MERTKSIATICGPYKTQSSPSVTFLRTSGGGGPKSVKFPEKMLKVLEMKVQNIAMGKDSAYMFSLLFILCFLRYPYSYSDQHIRRTIAIFYSSFKDES